MARRVSKKSHQQILMGAWWVRAILAVISVVVAYGFASLAIDSGSLWEYLAAIIFLWYAVHHAIRAVRFAFR
jgi:type VI protein secretion system component VasF